MTELLEHAEWKKLTSNRIGYFRNLQWIVGMSQGGANRQDEYAWMSMRRYLANHLSKERVESHVIKFPDQAIKLPEELTRDDIVQFLAVADRESDSLILPRAVTVAKFVREYQRELGLTMQNEHERKTTNKMVLGAVGNKPYPQEIQFPLDTLMPTSSTDPRGNVIAFKLRKSLALTRPIIIFSAEPRDTKFRAVVPIMEP